ncbi:uncharacterized protein LOC133889047 [Phragmites australis]|uniref:uncharacterized protein LOC133889047 n=1 Tax=Phragmites australis TaxID=29695 RepID=UPI002D77CAD5|nr:uncharacterized protein LOC133889047 [Phragmites australis]
MTNPQADAAAEEARLAALRQAAANATAEAKAAAARAEEAARRLAEYENLEQSQLHAQAVAVSNIKTMIPFVLDQTSSHYNRWRTFFLNTVTKYALDCLVLSDDDFSTDPHWRRMDCTIKSWLFSTVAPELIEAVSTSSPTSRSIWVGLEDQFIGNKETRAIILDAEFRTLVQGDLSVTDYCHKMKSMADALGDLGETVLDRTLVLNLLRGLNEKFSYMAALIKRTRPFPTFSDVRADLLIEEVTLASKATTPTALVATAPARPPAPRAPGPSYPPTAPRLGGPGGPGIPGGSNNGNGGGGSNRNRRRWRSNGNGGGQARPPGFGSPAWQQPPWNPFTGTFAV